ncbi:tetratricopeptide repeat protein [Kitasatospora sp. NPDC049285]|uniref:AfsR/SARP family transcriptional regulator n=1 Tax=Kitasatospora sp. NPDC049285 TaxID=3157096 RepID=UPI003414F51F
MEYTVLGPPAVVHRRRPVPLPGPRLRAALGLLLLQQNRILSTDQFIDGLWGERPPRTVRQQVHTIVSRLRQELPFAEAGEEHRLIADGAGYRLVHPPESLDATRFSAAVAHARQAAARGGEPDPVPLLRAALDLWQGEALAGVDAPYAAASRVRLDEERRAAHELLADLELDRSRHQVLIPELTAQLGAHPHAEGIAERLALALYRSGRQTDALEVIRRTRARLVEDYGLEPGPRLLGLEQAVLRDEVPAPASPSPASPATVRLAPAEPAPGTPAVPRARTEPPLPDLQPIDQLPSDTRTFTGRSAELDRLLALAREAVDPDATTSVVCAVDGMAGIGKTALAVHAAHRVRELFPSGRLFLDLHGHTPGGEPLTAAEALDRLLRALGTAPQSIPRDTDQRAALLRSRLAGTRTLILLDNAAGSDQVRPLLPGGPGCLVLVTSRRRLTALDDVYPVGLDLLSAPEAADLFHRTAGPGRVPEGHPGVAELVDLCGRVPLAVRITAARLRHRQSLWLEDVVAQLRDETGRLEGIRDGERDLAAVFDASCAALPAAERRLFRALGLAPGPDVDAEAAACLLGTGRWVAEDLLDALLDHHLLTQHTPGRYRFHDLVRLHARTPGDDPAAERERAAALERMLDYYQFTAHLANARIARWVRPGASPGCPPSARQRDFPDRESAVRWLRAEQDTLLAVARRHPARAIVLSRCLAALLDQDGRWAPAVELHRAAVAAARELGDTAAEADALGELGRQLLVAGDQSGAHELHRQALEIHRRLGDGFGEAVALWQLGRVAHMAQNHDRSAAYHEQALARARETDNPFVAAGALWGLGRVRQMAQDYAGAAELCRQALAGYRALDEPLGEANVLWDLGRIQQAADDLPAAATLLEQALAVYRRLGHRLGEANARSELGRLHHLAGDDHAAADQLQRALDVYRQLGERNGPTIARHHLARVRLRTGDLTAAAELLEQALAVYRSAGALREAANALHDLARVRAAQHRWSDAAGLWDEAGALYGKVGDEAGAAAVRAGLEGLPAAAT